MTHGRLIALAALTALAISACSPCGLTQRDARISFAQNSAICRVPTPVTLGIAINRLHIVTIAGSMVLIGLHHCKVIDCLHAPIENREGIG